MMIRVFFKPLTFMNLRESALRKFFYVSHPSSTKESIAKTKCVTKTTKWDKNDPIDLMAYLKFFQYAISIWRDRMHTFIVILFFLIYCPYFGWANIECSLNKNVSYVDLQLSDHTIQSMKLPDDRNATELNVFRCICDDDSSVSKFI